MSVLPKDYKEPTTSNYMKFEQGENTFRILSNVITGMEYWKTDEDGNRRPIRKRQDEKILISDLEKDKEGNLIMPKHFWAMVVYNYNAKKIQILEITQATIRKAIMALERNSKWGDASEYDITVEREGEGFDTTYTVTPNPKEPIDEKIVKEYKGMKINLEALYDGEDPFAEMVEKAKEIMK